MKFNEEMSIFMTVLLVCVVAILLIRKFIKIPDELFRKALHFAMLALYIPLVFGFSSLRDVLILIVAMIIIFTPLLFIATKLKGFTRFVNERKKGEYASSVCIAFCTMFVLFIIGWGILNDKYLILASVYAWGVGDGFAALIGKQFGKHKIKWKLADNNKSIEGSFAMFISSTVAVFIILSIRGGLSPLIAILISMITAMVSTIVELITKNGMDTATCPICSMAVLIPLLMFFGG